MEGPRLPIEFCRHRVIRSVGRAYGLAARWCVTRNGMRRHCSPPYDPHVTLRLPLVLDDLQPFTSVVRCGRRSRCRPYIVRARPLAVMTYGSVTC